MTNKPRIFVEKPSGDHGVLVEITSIKEIPGVDEYAKQQAVAFLYWWFNDLPSLGVIIKEVPDGYNLGNYISVGTNAKITSLCG